MLYYEERHKLPSTVSAAASLDNNDRRGGSNRLKVRCKCGRCSVIVYLQCHQLNNKWT